MAKTNMDFTKCVEGAQKLCISKYAKKKKEDDKGKWKRSSKDTDSKSVVILCLKLSKHKYA